ncbi:hypothetical protein CMI37_18030 [Candidatus Pacearchaeota archaeon]|nr:hypothetical protein [Candidatus Pacearchaeota archaeon]
MNKPEKTLIEQRLHRKQQAAYPTDAANWESETEKYAAMVSARNAAKNPLNDSPGKAALEYRNSKERYLAEAAAQYDKAYAEAKDEYLGKKISLHGEALTIVKIDIEFEAEEKKIGGRRTMLYFSNNAFGYADETRIWERLNFGNELCDLCDNPASGCTCHLCDNCECENCICRPCGDCNRIGCTCEL